MNTFFTLLRKATIGLTVASLLASPALAMPLPAPAAPAASAEVILASGDCYAIGMQQAAQAGGQLARATQEVRGGRQVCVIVVLMPARDGQRPRRNEIVVPMG